MDFGSQLILSKPIDPSVDYEEIDGTHYSSGIGVAMALNVKSRGRDTCLLDILDTAGQEEYSGMREEYMLNSQAFLIVFSVTSSASLQEAISIYDFCCRFKNSSSLPVVLCGNKNDLTDRREVRDAEALSLAKSRGMWYFSTSAKTGENVYSAFTKLVQMTPRTGVEFKITVLGAGGVGKSAITFRFLRDEFVEGYDPTIEDTFRKQINISGLSLPTRSNRNDALKEDEDFLIIDTPGAVKEVQNLRKIPKKDANIVFVNLGSLSPENFDKLDIKTLPNLPPTCWSCSAVLSTSQTCDFCGTNHPTLPAGQWQGRSPIEEYTLIPGSAPMSKPPAGTRTSPNLINNLDRGLVVFCIDISGSMNIRTGPNEMQSMWQSIQQTRGQVEKTISSPLRRLHHMQDAVQVHLERLRDSYPNRKVALIAFHRALECFLGGDDSPESIICIQKVSSLEKGIEAAQVLTNRPWNTVQKDFKLLSQHTARLQTKGSTALGSALAVALGLAKFHKEQFSASTEIFICTDGASNEGAGNVSDELRNGEDATQHGRAFYSLAGETAASHSAKINIIGIDGEGMALDVLSVAAQASGGVVTKVNAAELRREIRVVSQRRVLARNVVLKLHLPKDWVFLPDCRKNVTLFENTLTYRHAQVDDEASISFAFTVSQERRNVSLAGLLPIQAQITYTAAITGETKIRYLHQTMPLTSDRELAETGINVAFMGTYILQSIGFATNQLLARATDNSNRNKLESDAQKIRDTLYAYRKLLIRGAKNSTQQEELSKFEEAAEKLDNELKKMMHPATRWTAADRDRSSSLVNKYEGSERNSMIGSSNAVWGAQVQRRQQIW